MLKVHLWKKWIEALRSGKYKQTTLVLLDSRGKRCVNGVLLDLLNLPGRPLFSYPQAAKMLGFKQPIRKGCQFLNNMADYNNNGESFENLATRLEKYLANARANEVIKEAKKGAKRHVSHR